MPPHDPKDPIDLAKILLPKKEGPSVDSAQRINAGALLEQEQQAAAMGAPARRAEQKSSDLRPPDGQTSAPQGVPPPTPKKETSLVRPLETYSGDVAEVIEGGGVSAVSIAAAEAARAPQEAAAPAEDPGRYKRWAYWGGSAVLVVIALGLVAGIFLRATPGIATPSTFQAPFMAVDDTVLVPAPPGIARADLMQALVSAKEKVSLSLGLVAALYVGIPTTTGNAPDALPAASLLSLLSPSLPADLARTLEPAYLLGVHSFDENQPFLVLRVDSYQLGYAGMLAWESAMYQELSPLFVRTPSPRLPAPTQVATSTATSTAITSAATASTTPMAPEPFLRFTDQVVENHDARVLQNSAGDILMLWTFLDRNTLVITTNQNTLREVIRRINTVALVPQP